MMPASNTSPKFVMNEHPHWEWLTPSHQAALASYCEIRSPDRMTAYKRARGGLLLFPGVNSVSPAGLKIREALRGAIRSAGEKGLIEKPVADKLDLSLLALPGVKSFPSGGVNFSNHGEASGEFLDILDVVLRATGYESEDPGTATARIRRKSNPGGPLYEKDFAGEIKLLISALDDVSWITHLCKGDPEPAYRRGMPPNGHTTTRMQVDPPGLHDDGKSRTVTAYDGTKHLMNKAVSLNGQRYVGMRMRTPIAMARGANLVIGMEAHCREGGVKVGALSDAFLFTSPHDVESLLNSKEVKEIVMADVVSFEMNHPDAVVRRFCAWHQLGAAMYMLMRAPILHFNDFDPLSESYIPGTFSWTGDTTSIKRYPPPCGVYSGLYWTSAFNKRVGLTVQLYILLKAGVSPAIVAAFLRGGNAALPKGWALANAGDNMIFGCPDPSVAKAIEGVLKAGLDALPYRTGVETDHRFLGYRIYKVAGRWNVRPDGSHYLNKVYGRERGWKVANGAGAVGRSAQRAFYRSDPVGQICMAIEDDVLRANGIEPVNLENSDVPLSLKGYDATLTNILLMEEGDRIAWDPRFDHLSPEAVMEFGYASMTEGMVTQILNATLEAAP